MQIRPAKAEEVEQIEALMKKSMRSLGEGYYTKEQIDSCCIYVCVPDLQVISDGTYFVVENEEGKLIGCGGWSFRSKLYAGPQDASGEEGKDNRLDPAKDLARIRAMFVDPDYAGSGVGSLILETSERSAKELGFKKGALGATLSGLDFYKRKGWRPLEMEHAMLGDGVPIDVMYMEKEL